MLCDVKCVMLIIPSLKLNTHTPMYKRQHFPFILSVAPRGPAAATEVDTELHGLTSHNGSGYVDYMRSRHTTSLGFITALAWRYCSLAQSQKLKLLLQSFTLMS